MFLCAVSGSSLNYFQAHSLHDTLAKDQVFYNKIKAIQKKLILKLAVASNIRENTESEIFHSGFLTNKRQIAFMMIKFTRIFLFVIV